MSEPGYWMNETSGVLWPALFALFEGRELSGEHIAALRAYCRQWIMAGIWDLNPYMDQAERGWLAELRSDVETLTSSAAIWAWLRRVSDGGLDPL